MQLWGYVTHQTLECKGIYDESDRAYYISQEHLEQDLTMMLLDPKPVLDETAALKSVPKLSQETVGELLEKLGNSSVYFPRLAVPFEQWAALVIDNQWRQLLYERRLGQDVAVAAPKPVQIDLGRWFQTVFEVGWQSLDTLLDTDSGSLAFNFRRRNLAVNEVRKISIEGIKLIDLGMELGNQSVALLIGLTPETEQRVGIRVQLYPAGGQTYLPPNIRLALLSHSGATLQEYRSRLQDNLVQLKRFTCPKGKGFSIQVTLNNFSIQEDFIIESLAERES
jgi:hypothetical protein